MLEGGIKRISLSEPQNHAGAQVLCSGTKSERGLRLNSTPE